jgi:hypothetical protein
MKFSYVIKSIVSSHKSPLTPQEIKEIIKKEYPALYNTSTHIRNVKKGHYKDSDHALLAQIYSYIRNNKEFHCYKHHKPMKVSLKEQSEKNKMPSMHGKLEYLEKTKKYRDINYEQKIHDILRNAEKYYEAYYKNKTFSGPSLYFHLKALETRKPPGRLDHIEYVYAALPSWGMHRMGKGGAKMEEFNNFFSSVESVKKDIAEAQEYVPYLMDENKFSVLSNIFKSINVMASSTRLIGNSKVMHHMLPNIIPPIDRQYTLKYLKNNKNLRNNLDFEWKTMREIIEYFFIPITCNKEFKSKAEKWMANNYVFPWDTSLLKIVDNLVIGSFK